MLLTYPRKDYDERKLDKQLIKKLIAQHQFTISRLERNSKYYLGEHKFTERKEGPKNKMTSNHAKDIADTATGYFLGNAIKYQNTNDNDIEKLLKAFDESTVDENDHDNALDMAIYGVAYEYIYAREGTTQLDIKNLEPQNTFIVYDDSVEQMPLFAVYYYSQKDDVNNRTVQIANVFTENLLYQLKLLDSDNSSKEISETPTEHLMGEIPVVEY